MPWAAYADVLAVLGTSEAEGIATRSGAADSEEFWVGRIASSAPVVLAMLRGFGYLTPDDPDELSSGDAAILGQAVAEEAVLATRPYTQRNAGGEDRPPEIGPALRKIISGLVRLDMSLAPSLAFVAAASADRDLSDQSDPSAVLRIAGMR